MIPRNFVGLSTLMIELFKETFVVMNCASSLQSNGSACYGSLSSELNSATNRDTPLYDAPTQFLCELAS